MRAVFGIVLPVLLGLIPLHSSAYSFDDFNQYTKSKPVYTPTPEIPADRKASESVYHLSSEKPTVTIELPFQGGTGYMWFLEKVPPQIMMENHYVQMNPLPGGPGTSVWNLRVKPAAFKTPQKIVLEFTYQRIWESGYAKKQVITIFTE